MARWQLTEAHYIMGYPPDLPEGVEWEYKEIDRVNGRERRKRFQVPFYFETDSIVCHEGKGLPTDGIFFGDPTHAMLPLDDEARAISAKIKKPMSLDEFLPGQFSASLLGNLEAQLVKAMRESPIPVANSGVSKEEFDVLKGQLAEMMAMNQKLMEQLSGQGSGVRRI